MTRMRGRLGMLAALSVAVLLVGTSGREARAQGGATVSIVDFAFQPGSVEVAAGGTVTWTNTGQAPHTVTADDGSFDSGQLAPGASFSQTFNTAGTFTYHCSIHPQMTGTVTVTGGGGAQTTAPAQSGNQGGGTKTNKVPATGVGTMAMAGGTSALALLAGVVAVVQGVAAVRSLRRA
jgi:plastocyanin